MIIATNISVIELSNQHKYELLELVRRVPFNPEQAMYMELRIKLIETMEEYEAIKKNLLMNIIESKDRIAMGFSYSMTDISNCIRFMNMTARKIELKKL